MIGLDPEFNIKNTTTGKSKSAHLVWPERKEYWFTTNKQYPGANDLATVQGFNKQKGSEVERDGAAIEIRNLAPTDCRDNFIPYFAAALREVQLHVDANYPDYTVSADPVYVLEEDSLVGAPEDVCEAGCRPDMDAYNLDEKVASCHGNVRYTGGHLHFGDYYGYGGFNDWDVEKQAAVAIAMDYMIGLPLVAILGHTHSSGEAERREVYGQAGSFRYSNEKRKIEYRTPSSRAFLSPVLLSWATGMMRAMSVTSWTKESLKDRFFSVLGPQGVREIIDNHDVDGARMFYNKIIRQAPAYVEDESCLQYKLSGGGGSTYNPHFFMRAVDVLVAADQAGIHWPDDLKQNWGLVSEYVPEHHQYWGIHGAIAGQMDEDIFPQRAILADVIPAEYVGDVIYTHPKNGGSKRYLSAGAPSWLL